MDQNTISITGCDYGTAWPLTLVANSRLVMMRLLIKRNGLAYPDANMKSRVIRVLWYMREMGDEWVSVADLMKVGAGRSRHYRFTMPDGVKCGVWDVMEVGETRVKYRINDFGRRYLADSEAMIFEEMQRALKKVNGWKERKMRVRGSVMGQNG